jgi:hypothetical protein
MDKTVKRKKVRFPERVINFIDLIGEERRNELAGRTALRNHLLGEDNRAKLRLIEEEKKTTLDRLIEVINQPLLNELLAIFDDEDYGYWINSHFYKLRLIDYGLNLNLNEEIKYEESIAKIENHLNPLDLNFDLSNLTYEDFHAIRSEVVCLPVIKPLIEVLIFLRHLDLLDSNLYMIKNNRPLVTSISKDNNSTKIINDCFNALISEIKNNKSPFLNENDYNFYVDLLTLYFEGKEYKLPEKLK